jgi:hypothetical protein
MVRRLQRGNTVVHGFPEKVQRGRLVSRGRFNGRDGWKSVKPFLANKKVNCPVVIGDWDLAKLFGTTMLPVTLLIDRDSKIAELHVGMVDKRCL